MYNQYPRTNRQWMQDSTPAAATDAQRALIAKLEAEGRTATGNANTKRNASAYISALLSAPRAVVAAAPAAEPTSPTVAAADRPATEGMYRKGDDIYRVKMSGTGRLYAMKLVQFGGERLTDADEVVRFKFEYAAGAIYGLSATDKLSLDDAKAFGMRTGTCCVCARVLTDAKSVAAGIGPVCAKGL